MKLKMKSKFYILIEGCVADGQTNYRDTFFSESVPLTYLAERSFFSRRYIIPLLLVMVPIPASNLKTIDITATSIASIAIAIVHSYSAIGGAVQNYFFFFFFLLNLFILGEQFGKKMPFFVEPQRTSIHKRGSAIYFVPRTRANDIRVTLTSVQISTTENVLPGPFVIVCVSQ